MTFFKLFLVLLFAINQSYADNLVNKITDNLIKAPVTQGQFHQEKHLKFLQKPLMSTGTFLYHQNQGVIWQTLTPVASTLLLNESHLVTSDGQQDVPAAFGKIFKALLGGQLTVLQESFEMTGTEQKKSWQLNLTPKEATLNKVIKTIQLNGDSELRSLVMQEVSGNLTKIEFTHISHPANLTAEQQHDFEHLSP